MILADIISELKAAIFFFVLANVFFNHNVEHLAICLRFVDQEYNICEAFIKNGESMGYGYGKCYYNFFYGKSRVQHGEHA